MDIVSQQPTPPLHLGTRPANARTVATPPHPVNAADFFVT
jgi:hypothetical protein